MTRRFIYLLLFTCIAAACERTHTETRTLQIKGKPTNLVYVSKLSRGSVGWSFTGEIDGKVGVCGLGCESIVEHDYLATCGQLDTLSGRFDKQEGNLGRVEGVDAGTHFCLVFIPHEEGHGEVQVTFTESTIGGW